MNWREQLQPASFKGVAFGVMADDKEGGRRTVVHEFPQREDVFVEDLGAAVNRFTLQAFVVGDDYFSKRDALEKALNEPGPGTLVHPWYGEITVSQFAPYKVKHSAADGGMAVFTLSLARDAEPGAPSASVNASGKAFAAIDRGKNLACQLLSAMLRVRSQPSHVEDEARQTTQTFLEAIQTAFWGQDGGQTMPTTATETITPENLWNVARGLADESSPSSSTLGAKWLDWALDVAVSPLPLGYQTNQADQTGQTGQAVQPAHDQQAGKSYSRRVMEVNNAALTLFFLYLALLEAARHLALSWPESRQQARILREQFVDTVDAILVEAEIAGEGDFLATASPLEATVVSAEVLGDQLFTALVETRAATLEVLAEKARRAPDVVEYAPAAVLPALVLCHRLSGSIGLHEDLLTRNGIIHPGFVPVATLEVLTNG